ncbi:hypothetical protein [Streptomyces violaceus]|uniref:hypothetical protein n=1 Tax=Streptomyces violaceus TaxID=1936 RepID=UPI0035F49988
MSGDTGGSRMPRKRSRPLERARVGWPRALRELKDLLYEVYVAAGTPSLDEIVAALDDDELKGSPSRDTVRRIISDPSLPPQQADAVSVAIVLARHAAWDTQDLAGRVRELCIKARMTQGVGRPISEFSDNLILADLEVHPALDAGGARNRYGLLPVYVPRQHDTDLKKVVAAAVAGHSRIAVLVGGSSTGKTRALWEAVRDLPAPWRLWHPISPNHPEAALAGLADVAPHTVVWLNDAHHYLDSDPLGEQVAAGLRSLLNDPSRAPVLVVATLWPERWQALVNRQQHAQASYLLRGHEIDVADAFTRTDLDALHTADPDPRLVEAGERAHDGQVTQYLAGAHVLTARYAAARGASRALIHAAMDARRLGAGLRIPLQWLKHAVPGYLTETEWNAIASCDWFPPALEYVTQDWNGIPGILTRVATATPRNQRNGRPDGQSVTASRHPVEDTEYLLADYLDQYGRHHRADRIPPVDFWTAAANYAPPADMHALGDAAWARGLYRDAAQLHKHATIHGNPKAPHTLVRHFQKLEPADSGPAEWAAAYAALKNPDSVAVLLDSLRRAGQRDQINALLARDPATQVAIDNLYAVNMLLASLQEVGAREQIGALATRAAAHVLLHDADLMGRLLISLGKVGAREQVAALLARDPATRVTFEYPDWLAMLLASLKEVGAREQIDALLARDPAAHVTLEYSDSATELLLKMRDVGAQEQVNALASRAVAQVTYDNPGAVGRLLDSLRRAGAREQIDVLLGRDPATHVMLDDSDAVAMLLTVLRDVEARQQVDALAKRVAAHMSLDNHNNVGARLLSLRDVGAQEQVNALASRAAAQVALDRPRAVPVLLAVLRDVGAQEQVNALASRAATHALLDKPDAVAELLDSLRAVGAQGQVDALLARSPATHALLDNPDAVAGLLDSLRAVGAQGQVDALLARSPATHALLDNPGAATRLLLSLRKAGARKQFAALVNRLPALGYFDRFMRFAGDPERFRLGREPDGQAAPSWAWGDLA